MKMNARFMLLVFLLLLTGCGGFEQPSAKVTAYYDGFDAEEMDDQVASEFRAALRATSTQEYTSISTAGRVDIYATAEPGMTSKRFLKEIGLALAVRRGRLPHGCKIESPQVVTEQPVVPEVSVRETDTYQVTFDRECLARLGLAIGDVSESLAPYFDKPATQQGVSEMENLQLTTPDGKRVPLREVATIEIVPKPSHVIHTWPEKP